MHARKNINNLDCQAQIVYRLIQSDQSKDTISVEELVDSCQMELHV